MNSFISSSVVVCDTLSLIDVDASDLSFVRAYISFDGVPIGQQDVLLDKYISLLLK